MATERIFWTICPLIAICKPIIDIGIRLFFRIKARFDAVCESTDKAFPIGIGRYKSESFRHAINIRWMQ